MLSWVLVLGLAAAFEVVVNPNSSQCYGQVPPTQEIPPGKTVQVHLINAREDPSYRPINLRISDRNLKAVLIERVRCRQVGISDDKAVFVSERTGPYYFCIQNTGNEIELVSLKLLIGAAAHDYSGLPTTKDTQQNTSLLKSIDKTVKDIGENLRTLRMRDDELRGTNETIYNRVWVYSLCSVGLLLGLSVFQLLYLKHFFKLKKIV
jgi:hypothetical protein